MQQLELLLQKKNIPYKKGLLANLKSVYSNESKGSVLKKFLRIDSHLKEIPKGIKGRKSAVAVYHRCIEIEATAFKNDVLATLIEGKSAIE